MATSSHSRPEGFASHLADHSELQTQIYTAAVTRGADGITCREIYAQLQSANRDEIDICLAELAIGVSVCGYAVKPRQNSCGCCTAGCVCWHHRDIPRGISVRVCDYHQRHPHTHQTEPRQAVLIENARLVLTEKVRAGAWIWVADIYANGEAVRQ